MLSTDTFKETGVAVVRKWQDADFKRMMDIENDIRNKHLRIGALDPKYGKQINDELALGHIVALEALKLGDLKRVRPYEVIKGMFNDHNLLMRDNGARIFNLALTGGGFTVFSNANARLGVGDSAAAAANTQTDLQAAANKLRKVMDATYPSVFAAGANGNKTDWRSSFITGEAEYAWAEWATFNAAAAGDMLNRAVQSFGTKAAGVTWQLTTTTSLA